MKTITGRKIRLSVVGCGRISKKHFESVEKHCENLELVAVCDTDPVVLRSHKKKYRVNGYLRLEEMLEREDQDLVVICTPSGVHPEQTVMAARSGLHVVTEKPMATRWQDGVRMVKVCDEAGVRLFVVKQKSAQYHAAIVEARD